VRQRHFSLVLTLVALICSATAPSAVSGNDAKPSVSQLIAKHLQWLGGEEALSKLSTLRMSGTLKTAGVKGSVSALMRRDGYSRTDYDLKVFKGAQAITPEDAWSLNASGQVEELGKNQAKSLRRELSRSFGVPFLSDSLSWKRMDPEERGGRSWTVLRLEYPNRDTWDLFLDPEDGSSEWSRSMEDTKTTWIHDSDFRIVDGVRMAFQSEQSGEDPGDSNLVSWSKIETNVEIAPTAFSRPATRKIARIVGGAASTPWMKTVSNDPRSIRLRGEINGRAADILLDSGAGITVVSRSLAKELKLKSEGTLTAEGTAASAEAALVGGIKLKLGELELDGITAATIDLSQINAQLPRPLEVILGKELFHAMLVDVDYPNSRVRFCDPESFENTGLGHKVAILPAADGHKLIEINVENLPPALVDVDTGSGATLDIFGFYADENELLKNRARVSEAMAAGVGGTTVNKIASLETLTVGGYELRGVPVGFFQGKKGSFHTRRIAGNLGAGILSRFRILFDYPDQALWLTPGENWDRPFERNRTGLQTTYDDGALRVVFVAPGSPAEKAGWKAGERIVAIDGEKVKRDDSRAWRRQPAGTKVQLKTDKGEQRELLLADYY